VRSVVVEDDGEGRAPPLRADLRLRVGARFRYESWQEDRDRLEAEAARQGFAEAFVVARREPRRPPESGDSAEVALRYLVRRGPRTTLLIQGYEAEEELRRRILEAWALGDFVSSIEEEAEALVQAHLAGRGHFTPRITATATFSEDERAKSLVLDIDPGPRGSRRRVDFQGAEGMPLARLQALVKGRALLDRAFAERRQLARAVRSLYRQEGYLAVGVRVPRPVLEAGEALLRVEIEEGPRFRRGELQMAGCAGIPCAEVEAALGLEPGAPHREADIDAARDRVLALYRARGWSGARTIFDGQVRPEPARVDLKITVTEGPRRVLHEVVVAGGKVATRRALDPLVTLRPGEPVVAEQWAEVRRRLYETGLVRGVSLEAEALAPRSEPPVEGTPDPTTRAAPSEPAEELVRARLTYDAWPELRLRYGLQLVTEEPIAASGDQAVDIGGSIELTRATLFGRALSTALSAEARPDLWNVRGVVSAPRTFKRPLRSSLFLVREHEKAALEVEGEASRAAAERDAFEITLEERYRPRGRLELALSYNVQWLTLRFPTLRLAPLDLRPARVIGTVLLDGRSSILDPRHGYFSSLSLEYGAEFLGSEFPIRRLFTQQYGYLPLPAGLLFASGARYDWASGDGQRYLATERLGLGGATTVRGYDRDTVNLLDLLGLTGATTQVLVLNEELRFPLWGDLRGVAFLDYGQARADLDRGPESEWRLGTGVGLRYSTPVGVLRFDVGFPLRGTDKSTKYYFGLGQAF
jgi:outer membrane protein assembly factor BamA